MSSSSELISYLLISTVQNVKRESDALEYLRNTSGLEITVAQSANCHSTTDVSFLRRIKFNVDLSVHGISLCYLPISKRQHMNKQRNEHYKLKNWISVYDTDLLLH